MQMWATGQPDIRIADEKVLMTAAGWKTASSPGVAANSVICSKTAPIYTLNPYSSKYYSFKMDIVTQTQAQSFCKAEGGSLAITYGTTAKDRVLNFFGTITTRTRSFWVAGIYNSTTGRWNFPDSEDARA